MVLILIVYDISDNGVRLKLANYLKSKGFTRIQRSVFVGNPLPSTLKDVLRVLPRYIDSENDVIHVFPLTEYSLRYMRVYGNPLSEITLEKRVVEVF